MEGSERRTMPSVPVASEAPRSPDDDTRAVSPAQLVTNLTSVLNPTSAPRNLQDTRAWRLEWWGLIQDYTLRGPYFWTGKGFGINLADEDGFQVGMTSGEPALRSPHNGHLSILARTGLTAWAQANLRPAVQVLFRPTGQQSRWDPQGVPSADYEQAQAHAR